VVLYSKLVILFLQVLKFFYKLFLSFSADRRQQLSLPSLYRLPIPLLLLLASWRHQSLLYILDRGTRLVPYELEVKSVNFVYLTFLDMLDQTLVQIAFIFLIFLDSLGNFVAHVLEGLVCNFPLLLLIFFLLLSLLAKLQL